MKTQTRTKQTGEVFTPRSLVLEMLDKLPEEQFTDHSKTFLDNSCGNGQFLIEVIKRKVSRGSTIDQAINTTYGVDLMVDNVCDTMARIVFYKELGIDIFNEDGTPVDELEIDAYKDDATFDSLIPGTFKVSYRQPYRTYKFNGKTLFFKKGKFGYRTSLKKDGLVSKEPKSYKDVKGNVNKYWILQYAYCNNEIECSEALTIASIHPKTNMETPWKEMPNIVCADALKYHYEFDRTHPYLEKEFERIENIFKEEKKKEHDEKMEVILDYQ